MTTEIATLQGKVNKAALDKDKFTAEKKTLQTKISELKQQIPAPTRNKNGKRVREESSEG